MPCWPASMSSHTPHPVNAPARERALAVLFNQVVALVVERWTDGQPVGLILRRIQRLLDDIDAEGATELLNEHRALAASTPAARSTPPPESPR